VWRQLDRSLSVNVPFNAISMAMRLSVESQYCITFESFLQCTSKENQMNTAEFQACIDACNRCATACDLCADACRSEDATAMARCIALDTDCAQICRVAADFMARGSESVAEICRACAAVCDACAAECAQHQMDHCQQCAEACRQCAEACRRMAATDQQNNAGASLPQGTGATTAPTAASAEGSNVEQGKGAGMTSMT
jgi:hypothetical protein